MQRNQDQKPIRRCRCESRRRSTCDRLPLHPGCMCLGFARETVQWCLSPVAERVFLENIVDIGWGQVPEMRTMRNTRIAAIGGCGPIEQRAAAFRVGHAADGPADPATPPSTGSILPPAQGAASVRRLRIAWEATSGVVEAPTRAFCRVNHLGCLEISERRSVGTGGLSASPLRE